MSRWAEEGARWRVNEPACGCRKGARWHVNEPLGGDFCALFVRFV